MFLNDLGHSWQVNEGVCTGELLAIDELCVPSTHMLRASVLAAVGDVVAGGVANVGIAPRIPLTVDLSVHTLRHSAVTGRITMEGRNLKTGRSTVVNEVLFRAGEAPVAVVYATFMPSPRPEDVMEEVHWGRPAAPPKINQPIMEQIGIRDVEPGVIELDLVPYVKQPSGTIQGGAIAMMAERAAETVLNAPVSDLEIRYLSAVRVGPGRATATALGDGHARVEIRDAGNHDRLATLVIARV
jgi:acyl-coenzyme A thioesterase PaaI-like protein